MTAQVAINPESSSPRTDRTVAILELLAQFPLGASIADLTRELGISQNSVFRITGTLHERGYLHRRESDKKFVLSNKLFDLSRPQVNQKSLAVCAYEALKILSAQTGETSQLLVRSENKAVVLEQVSGRHPVKVLGEVGLRVPLYSCAPGKAILAHLSDSEVQDWLGQTKLKRFTPTTHATKRSLLADLHQTRERGYAIDLAEGLEGIHCAAAPIFDQYQYPVAAVTVMAPTFRLPESDIADLGKLCQQTASEIRNRLMA
ncbi:MAG: IclR family transcriptional regulator [Verrucomicrobiota bacterium]